MKIIGKNDQLLTTWSGGTTRQVYIFPEGSSYAERNFKIRFSTATVEVETSQFTSLPGYFRRLMVLEGALKLEHQNQHHCVLQKFEEDHFLGEWTTVSYGKAIDFNAMSTGQYTIRLKGYTATPSTETIDYSASPVHQAGFYIHKGACTVTFKNEKLVLGQGDFMLLDKEESNGLVEIQYTEQAEVVRVMIQQLF